jgi:phosphate transport system protein
MRKQFDQDLNRLKERLLMMAATAEQMIRDTTSMLVKWDSELVAPVRAAESKLDISQREIDEETVRLIAVHTPVAGDLRLLLMVTRINAELEHIGDHTMDIGFYAKTLFKGPPLKPLVDLPRMAEITMSMLRGSLDAFSSASSEKAFSVIAMDDTVDDLHDQIFRELMTYVLADAKAITRVMEYVLIARAFERIADHAVNIAEDVVYMVKGEDIRHQGSTPETKPIGGA